MSTLRSTFENLIEAMATDHESRTHHNFRKYDEFRQHCSTCFYLKMAEDDSASLPGEDDIIITRKNRAVSEAEEAE